MSIFGKTSPFRINLSLGHDQPFALHRSHVVHLAKCLSVVTSFLITCLASFFYKVVLFAFASELLLCTDDVLPDAIKHARAGLLLQLLQRCDVTTV